jgi:hypothetical protein
MSEQVVSTSFGKFRLTISEDIKIDYMTRENTLLGHMVSLGGKNNCVQINVPLQGDVAKMLHVGAEHGGCEIDDNEIRGQKIVNLVLLAFTIVTQSWPQIKTIEVEDRSHFPCKLSNGTDFPMSLAVYNMALHHKTWYEMKFGAYLKNPSHRALYETHIKGFDAPHPQTFDFKNKILDEVLGPIFVTTKTWTEFFNIIKTKDNRCELMSLWYKSTVGSIIGTTYDNDNWLIDLSNPLIHPIEYTILKKGGSRRRTRKMKYKGWGGAEIDDPVFVYNNLSYSEMYNMDFPALRKMIKG